MDVEGVLGPSRDVEVDANNRRRTIIVDGRSDPSAWSGKPNDPAHKSQSRIMHAHMADRVTRARPGHTALGTDV